MAGRISRRLLSRSRAHPAFFTRDALAHLTGRPDVEIGEWTYGSPTIFGVGESPLHIGRYCSIALEVTIFLGYEHNVSWVSTYPFPDPLLLGYFPEAASIRGHPRTRGPVVIGNDVWLGHGATVLSGVTIGDGAVVGARSVVTSDVPPYSVVAGSPARVVRRRFDDDSVSRLLELRWWDWPQHVVAAAIPRLCSSEGPETITALEDLRDAYSL